MITKATLDEREKKLFVKKNTILPYSEIIITYLTKVNKIAFLVQCAHNE